MSWPRGSLLASLFVIALPQAFADAIIVDTTKDDGSTTSCSLRHAVEYFNEGRPAAGWKGCKRDGEASTSDSITLAANEAAYEINSSAIDIRTDRNLSISGAGSKGESLTKLKVGGNHRAFVIDGSATHSAPDCAATTSCEPTGAPKLDPASDTGASTTDWLTMVTKPTFTGTAPAPAEPTYTVKVILYAKAYPYDGDYKELASRLADTATNAWSLAPSEDLSPGEYHITFTTQQLDADGKDVGDESVHSAITTLRVYNDPSVVKTISLSGLQIEGCGSACSGNADDAGVYTLSNGLKYTRNLAGTLGNGGVIYTRESLSLSDVAISKGDADRGGAIHGGGSGSTLTIAASVLRENVAAVAGGAVHTATGVAVSLEDTLLGGLRTAEEVLAGEDARIKGNQAPAGAALYLESNSLSIASSALLHNKGGAVVAVANPTASGSTTSTTISNSTFSGNQGLALSLRGAQVNVSTIVENGGGIDANNASLGVHNTILAGNGNDCLNLSGTVSMTFSLIFPTATGGCPATGSGMQVVSNTGTEMLMATGTLERPCGSANGILCPLSVGDEEDNNLPYHLPRLLSSYAQKTDSPIINKGAGSGTSATVACLSSDQRDKARGSEATNYCDIGAIEVQVITGTVRSGDSISYYESYPGLLSQNLGDEELLDPAYCPLTAPVPDAIGYRNDVPGCPWLETLPPRGTVTFGVDADGNGTYTYTPFAPFHGFDEFNFRVMTTLSHLNEEDTQKGRQVSAKVIVEPEHGISHSSLGGGFGLGAIGIVVFLGVIRVRRGL